MCVFGTISPSQRMNHPDDFSALFESRRNHRLVNEIRNERIRGDEYVGARNEDWHENSAETLKEPPQCQSIVISQYREPRDGLTLAAIERRRNAPDATFALSQFL